MFIVMITYTKPLEMVLKFVDEHRAYLDKGYAQNFLIASGPKNPRTGGVIISQLKDRKTLEDFLAHDPFKIHNVAEYEIIEFSPVKYHDNFARFID